MKFLGIGLQQALFIGGILAATLAVLYLLKLRRRRIEVPFSPLWAKVLMNREASNWLQRLKRLLSLLLQLLILALILFALADPQPEKEIERGRSIAVIIDTSASMAAVEPGEVKTRFEKARDKVEEVIKNLGPHDRMTIIAMDGQVRSITGDFTGRPAVLREALSLLKPSATEANVLEALRTAADSVNDRRDPEILLLSDGAHGKELSVPRGLIGPHIGFKHEIVANLPVYKDVAVDVAPDPLEEDDGDSGDTGDGDPPTEGGDVVEGEDAPAEGDGDGDGAPAEGDAAAAGEEGEAAAEDPEEDPALPPAPVFEKVIDNPEVLAGNISISGFNIRRYLSNKLDYEIYIQARNHFPEPVCVELSLFNLTPNERIETGKKGETTTRREWLEKMIPLRDPNAAVDVESEIIDNPCRPTSPEMVAFELPPGGKSQRFYPRQPMASDYVRARVGLARRVGEPADAPPKRVDALPVDNEAFVLIPKFKRAKILLVTPGNLFLEAALLFNQENYETDFFLPEEATPALIRNGKYDLVIFDNSVWNEDQIEPPVAPRLPGPGNYMYINPRGSESPFDLVKSIDEEVFVERVNRKHAMSRWLVMQDLNIARGVTLRTKDEVRADGSRDEVVVKAIYGPLIITHRTRDTRLVGVGFSIVESDIVLRIALPVLVINAVDWFLDDAGSLIQAYRTGESWHIPVPPGVATVNVKDPAGKTEPGIPTHEGEVVYYGADSGFYALTPGEESGVSPDSIEWEIAANFVSERESNLIPMPAPLEAQEAQRVDIEKKAETVDELGEWGWIFNYLDRFDLWLYCVFLVIGLLLFEWLTFHRRYTV